jgi:hypothetical protein
MGQQAFPGHSQEQAEDRAPSWTLSQTSPAVSVHTGWEEQHPELQCLSEWGIHCGSNSIEMSFLLVAGLLQQDKVPSLGLS